MSVQPFLQACFGLVLAGLVNPFPPAGAIAQEPAASEPVPGEADLASLISEFEAAQEKHYAEEELIPDEKWKDENFRIEHRLRDPSLPYLRKLGELEERFRGTETGLSCLHRQIMIVGAYFFPDHPVTPFRSQAYRVLAVHYREHSDIDRAFRYVGAGPYVPGEVDEFLNALISSPHRHVRGNAAVALAGYFLGIATAPANLESRLSLMDRDDPGLSDDVERTEKSLREVRDVDIPAMRRRASELLELVESEYGDVLQFAKLDIRATILKPFVGEDGTMPHRPTLAEIAAGIRADSRHQLGQPISEIDAPDVHGQSMKLSDFRGKVTVLMFSFKGCGPCEAMYPDNRALLEEMKNRQFAFVGVQRDEDRQTTLDTLAAGDITWPVWWDGEELGLSTGWNVQAFPSNYVVDHQGTIRYRGLDYPELARAVRLLVAEAASGGR